MLYRDHYHCCKFSYQLYTGFVIAELRVAIYAQTAWNNTSDVTSHMSAVSGSWSRVTWPTHGDHT